MSKVSLSSHKITEIALIAGFLAMALTVGYLQIAAWSNRIGWDTVSYLSLAQALREGHYALFLSPYWSLLYPAALGTLTALQPAVADERGLLSAFQFFSFALLLAASIFFWKIVLRLYFAFNEGVSALSRPLLIVYMAAVTLFASLVVGDLSVKTPDILASAIYIVANGMILLLLDRSMTDRKSAPTKGVASPLYVALCGFLLGLSYLTKAFYIAWSIPCLILLFWQRQKYGLTIKNMIVMAAVTALTTAIYIVPLSLSLQHFTFGEAGKYQTAFCTAGTLRKAMPMVHGNLHSLHPSRIFSVSPKVYEFATPFDVSYAPWFNPHYFNEGLVLENSLPIWLAICQDKFTAVCSFLGAYVMLLAACLAIAGRSFFPYSLERLKILSPVLLSAWFSLAILFILACPVERYYTGFIYPVFAGFLLAFKGRNSKNIRALRLSIVLLSAVLLVVFSCKSFMHAYFALPVVRDWLGAISGGQLKVALQPDPHRATAALLNKLGVGNNDKVARISLQQDGEFYWIRLAKVRVVCESVEATEFFKSRAVERATLYKKLRDFGVKAIVLDWSARNALQAPVPDLGEGWQPVSGTKNYILIL